MVHLVHLSRISYIVRFAEQLASTDQRIATYYKDMFRHLRTLIASSVSQLDIMKMNVIALNS